MKKLFSVLLIVLIGFVGSSYSTHAVAKPSRICASLDKQREKTRNSIWALTAWVDGSKHLRNGKRKRARYARLRTREQRKYNRIQQRMVRNRCFIAPLP